jgi:hypothetical protein
MSQKEKALTMLRLISVLTTLVGLLGVVAGLYSGETMTMLGMQVPLWVLGVTVAYVGVRYWRRVPQLDESIATDGKFSFANLTKRG